MDNKKTIDVIYTIKADKGTASWDAHEIVSNIANDEMIYWKISKSLSDELLQKAAVMQPEQLLIQYAEIQKRNLQIEIEALDNLELTIKTKTEKIASMLDNALAEQETVFEEKHIAINQKISEFKTKISDAKEKIKEVFEPVDDLKKTLDSLSSYEMEKFFGVIETIRQLQERNPELLNFIVKNFQVKQ